VLACLPIFSIHVDVYLCVHVLMFSIRVSARVRVHADKRSPRDSMPSYVYDICAYVHLYVHVPMFIY